MKDYEKQKTSNQLAVTKTQSDFNRSMKKVAQTYSPDGYLRFGDKIMLSNKQTDSCLVVNVRARVNVADESYECTASSHISGPSARSIFVIERVDEQDGFEGNEVHFGQQIRFTTNNHLHSRKLYLKSQHHTPIVHSKFQEVTVSIKKNFDSVWMAEYTNPNERFEAHGNKVLANGPLIVKHQSTG